MKTETSKATGNLIVSEDTTFHHLFATEVKVEANVVARLFGNISDKLQVEKNAVVYLHGRCEGIIVNNGGIIYRFLPSGTVDCMESELGK